MNDMNREICAENLCNTDRMQATVSAAAPVRQTEAETEKTKRMKEKFGFFGPSALLYAIFYTFCMFKNGSGVTFPFFVAGSLLFLCLSLAKLGTTLKRGSVFYMVAMMLLSISTFCTDDARIIFFNKLGIFLLMMSLLLKQYYDTSQWGFGKFLGSICQLTFCCVGDISRPFRDAAEFRKQRTGKGDRQIWALGIGMLVGVPLLLVVMVLLSAADAVFRQLTDKFLENINLGNIVNVIFRIAFLFLFSYCLTSYLCKKKMKEEVKDNRTGEPVLAITVTGMLTVLYLIFSGIQVAGLFLGKLQLPEGYSYAEYAREGFFQLLAVSLLNLVIVLICLSFFRESKVLKMILTIMSLCTFVMIASSAMRMCIYIMYYYLTFLRVLVLWALALLAVLFIGVIINIYREDFPLFRYSMTVVTVLYLALSFAHPDYIIAKVNVANIQEMQQQDAGAWEIFEPYDDYRYLSWLCADAAPVLVPCFEKLGYDMEAFWEEDPLEYIREQQSEWRGRSTQEAFGYYWMKDRKESAEGLGIRTFNVSRYRMCRLLNRAAE